MFLHHLNGTLEAVQSWIIYTDLHTGSPRTKLSCLDPQQLIPISFLLNYVTSDLVYVYFFCWLLVSAIDHSSALYQTNCSPHSTLYFIRYQPLRLKLNCPCLSVYHFSTFKQALRQCECFACSSTSIHFIYPSHTYNHGPDSDRPLL